MSEKKSLFSRWLRGVGQFKENIKSQFARVWSQEKTGEKDWEALEEMLIQADIGPGFSMEIVEGFRKLKETAGQQEDWRDWLYKVLLAELRDNVNTLFPVAQNNALKAILLVGINGVGKTTVAGKLAYRAREEGETVSLVAGDTFRAAAVEQLEVWAQRSGSHFFRGSHGADPGAVIFDGIDGSLKKGDTLVIIDTAGRSHVNKNLLGELEKIGKIVCRQIPRQNVNTLLVIDAMAGQNAFLQAEAIGRVVPLDGVVLTKWDSQARGGIVFRIRKELGLAIKYVGVGENIDDLISFDSDQFVRALVFEETVS
ncbi:MAG TPA: signal recognition particle-docking protein FtsY [Atribacteraceae bacterium]|nr:signal recognition particle-docking protein FtsY [Atribacteraceae bacterium]